MTKTLLQNGTQSSTELLPVLQPYSQHEMLMAVGSYSPPDQQHFRHLFFIIHPKKIELVGHHWMSQEDAQRLFVSLPNVSKYQGQYGDMFGSKPKFVWMERSDKKEFLIWKKNKLSVAIRDGQVVIRHFFSTQEVDCEQIARINSFGWDSWPKLGVSLTMKQGPEVILVSKKSYWALLDPTYDYLDFTLETDWKENCASSVAKFLGVPLLEDQAKEK